MTQYHELTTDGVSLFKTGGIDYSIRQNVFLTSYSKQVGGLVLKLSDLAIPAYTMQSRQVKQEHTCQHNFGGILERGKKCALYSTLSEICIVVSKETSVSPDGVSEESWQVATDNNGKTIGCANENL